MKIFYITGAIVVFLIALGYLVVRVINKIFDDYDKDDDNFY